MMTKPVPCPPAPGPLEEYAARFDDLFTRVAQRRGFREYLAGLLAPRDRNKTLTALAGAEPVTGAQHPAVQRLQFFLSHTGATVARGGPGSMMYVPRGCPHAFANPGPGPARMIFLVSPSGHEHYQKELAELVASAAGPLDAAIAELRARHDIEQLTPR